MDDLRKIKFKNGLKKIKMISSCQQGGDEAICLLLNRERSLKWFDTKGQLLKFRKSIESKLLL